MTPVLALVLAAPLPCGPLDLPTALALATVRSDEVAIKQAEFLAAEADRSLAKAARIIPVATVTLVGGPVPAAHGTVQDSQNSNRSLDGLGPFGRIDINVVQPIWTWGLLNAAREAADAGARARALLVTDTAHQVQLRVVRLYWGIALAHRLLNLAAEVESAVRDADQRIAKSLEAADGEVTQEDKFRVDVFHSEVRQRRIEAEKGLKLARVALAATLAISEPDLQLKEDALPNRTDSGAIDRAQALREAQLSRPDLLALDQSIVALEAQVHANRAAVLPQFFAAGSFAYSRAPNRDIQTNPWIRDDFNLLGFGVVLGLRQNFAIPTLLAQVDKAEAQLSTARRQRAGLARLVDSQTEEALVELTAAQDKDAAAHAALAAGRAWFRSASLNFGAGLSEVRALVEAYTGYVKTQIDSAQADYDLLVARARLDQVIGRPLSKGENVCVLR
jgi:outer membrane protein TolC